MNINCLIYLLLYICFMLPVYSFDYTAEAQSLSNRTAKELANKYDLKIVGSGGGTMNGVERLSLSFQLDKSLTIESARKLILECLTTFQNDINSNSSIRPYLAEYPFPISEISVYFYVSKPIPGQSLSAFAFSAGPRSPTGSLRYMQSDTNNQSRVILEETLNEANQHAQNTR